MNTPEAPFTIIDEHRSGDLPHAMVYTVVPPVPEYLFADLSLAFGVHMMNGDVDPDKQRTNWAGAITALQAGGHKLRRLAGGSELSVDMRANFVVNEDKHYLMGLSTIRPYVRAAMDKALEDLNAGVPASREV